jgi:polygalacturonase
MKRIFSIFLIAISFLEAGAATVWTNVAEKGADRTGTEKCTAVINSLIDSLASEGGGTIYFPAGKYLTGAIVMKSNITLWLDAGSVILFSDDFDDYLPMVPSRWEDVRVKNFRSQIYAYQCENIAIRGSGHLEGQGKKWWDHKFSLDAGRPVDGRWQEIFRKENTELLKRNVYLQDKHDFLRPPMVTTYECKNVLIEGVSFSNPPFWTIMPCFSENITITGITIRNTGESPNTDGIDPSSCRNVHISNCHISVGDDCIVIKSGRDEDGREAGVPTENVTITNCTMLEGHGGVVIGSEMSGGVRRVTISNCVFEGTDRGIRLKTMRGRGGEIQDLRVSNITMNNMVREGIMINMRYQPTEPEPVSERTPAINSIQISNINIRGARQAVAIYGLEEREASGISFDDIRIFAEKGIVIENASGVTFHNIEMNISEGSPLDARDSKNITWDMVTVGSPLKDLPFMSLSNCSDIRVTNCFQREASGIYVEEDENCSNIYILNNILPGISSLSAGLGKNVVKLNNITSK